MKLFKHKPKYQVVEFNDGTYGIREFTWDYRSRWDMLPSYVYLRESSDWWETDMVTIREKCRFQTIELVQTRLQCYKDSIEKIDFRVIDKTKKFKL